MCGSCCCCWCMVEFVVFNFFVFFKQKTAYEMRISDWSSDVCSSDLGVFQFAKISHDWSPLPPRSTKRVIVVGIALFDEARVVGESGDVVLGEITQHRVHALLQLVQAGAEMEACGLACAFEDLRSEEHTSELQSLMRISYVVFCL